jgi:energy-coupling factor transport system ATP-binding protein
MIEIRNLRYGSLHVGNLDLPRGITTVIGRNGSGKTTFLRLCAGIALPDTGTILIDGKSPRQREIGWINEFPDRNMLFSNVRDEIASSLRFRYFVPDDTDRLVQRIADRLGIQNLLSRQIQSLSGGEKVLVALAAALVFEPEILILDEYDSHLDEKRCSHLEQILLESGCDYILRCTQQMETAVNSDNLVMLEDGRLIHTGTPRDVFPLLTATLFYPLSWRAGL